MRWCRAGFEPTGPAWMCAAIREGSRDIGWSVRFHEKSDEGRVYGEGHEGMGVGGDGIAGGWAGWGSAFAFGANGCSGGRRNGNEQAPDNLRRHDEDAAAWRHRCVARREVGAVFGDRCEPREEHADVAFVDCAGSGWRGKAADGSDGGREPGTIFSGWEADSV